jgi:hypothetical protein
MSEKERRNKAPDPGAQCAERQGHHGEGRSAQDLRDETLTELELPLHDHLVEPVDAAEQQDSGEGEQDFR